MTKGTKAGWAEIDITPSLGLPMGGRGPRYAPGNEILDTLMAQALVLEDAEGSQILLVSMDLIGLSYPRSAALRYELSALTGIPFNAIILNFAHTHSGPMVNFKKYPGHHEEPVELLAYHADLRHKILKVAQNAGSAMQPVLVSLHQGNSNIGINRRKLMEDGTIALAPNPEGPYNPDLWVLDIQVTTSAERTLVFSVGCHPVIVYGYAWQAISADYPGACRRALKQRLGGKIHCQFFQGLAGNVRPRILADHTSGVFRKSNADDHINAGQKLAEDILSSISVSGEILDLQLQSRAGWVSARRDPSKVNPLQAWQDMAKSDDELTRNVGQYWADRMEQDLSLAQVSPMEVGILRLSQKHAIAWISAEAVAEWMPLIRSINPKLNFIVWGYCQFVPTYLPTDALLAEGGYEVINANMYEVNGPGPFAQGLEEDFIQVFRDLMQI